MSVQQLNTYILTKTEDDQCLTHIETLVVKSNALSQVKPRAFPEISLDVHPHERQEYALEVIMISSQYTAIG